MGLFDKGKFFDDQSSAFDGKEPMLQFTVLYLTFAFFFCIVTETVPLWIPVLYGVIFTGWAAYKGSMFFWRFTRGRPMTRFTVLYGLFVALICLLVGPFANRSETLTAVAAALAAPYALVLFLWLTIKACKALARLVGSRRRRRAIEAKEAEVHRAAGAQWKREDARASCDVLYALHGPEIRDRFPQEMFDAFVARHLGDDRSPEYVQQRARELCDILRKHLEKAQGPQKKKTLAELAQWFLEEKRQIDAAALDEQDKQLLLTQLEERYVKLQENYLRSVQP